MNTSRLLAAIQILKDGQSFLFENLQLQIIGNIVSVRGWTTTVFIENLTREKAVEELTITKEDYKNLLISYPLLAEIVKEKVPTYSLNYDTGKSGIRICEEESGKIIWNINLK